MKKRHEVKIIHSEEKFLTYEKSLATSHLIFISDCHAPSLGWPHTNTDAPSLSLQPVTFLSAQISTRMRSA